MKIDGKVIRVCLESGCGVIYLDSSTNQSYIKPCKKCDHGTGFFESLEHFYQYIDSYGIDTDTILDPELKHEVCKHYGLEE